MQGTKMSSVVVIAPIVIANWPVITAAVTAAIGSMGFTLARATVAESAHASANANVLNRAEIEVEDSEILANSGGTEQTLVVEKDGVRAIFSRDARGALKLCVEGKGLSKQQLHEIGTELMGRVTQQYVYHRIVSELQQRNLTIVDEQVEHDQTVKIRIKNF
jgi:hypothetical protein